MLSSSEQKEALKKTIDFIDYLDKLKYITRRNSLHDKSRQENTAEHSWHAAMAALLLVPFANEPVDINKVIKMLLIHDLIEIEAGDTFVYDLEAAKAQEAKENEAARRIFMELAPPDQGPALLGLWEEFEARQTPEAKFAKAIDRFMPIFSNLINGGASWQPNQIAVSQVRTLSEKIRDGSYPLWEIVDQELKKAVEEGSLRE